MSGWQPERPRRGDGVGGGSTCGARVGGGSPPRSPPGRQRWGGRTAEMGVVLGNQLLSPWHLLHRHVKVFSETQQNVLIQSHAFT